MKKTLVLLMVILLFNSCKKEESWEYWDDLSNKKIEEILTLSNSYNCTQTSDLTIQEIYTYCPYNILVHKNDIKKFEELYEQYRDYNEKANKAGRPLLAIYCWLEPPIKIGCKENKAYLVQTFNITLEDLEIEMPKLYSEIKNHHTSLTCAQLDDLQGVVIYTGENKEAIAANKADHAIFQKIQTYRMLNFRKAELQNKQFDTNYSLKVNFKCENNSIKAEFE